MIRTAFLTILEPLYMLKCNCQYIRTRVLDVHCKVSCSSIQLLYDESKNFSMIWRMYLQHLRRHGDILKRTVGGHFIVQGRSDDTMNLGGIKVTCSTAPSV